MRRAAELMVSHTAGGFAVSICPSEYKAATSDRFRSQHGSAYTLCLKEATAEVGRWAEYGNMLSPIAYFFDAGHRNQEQANQYFARVHAAMPRERAKIRLGTWTFAGDDLVWPLKAADLLAYAVYQAEYFGLPTPANEAFGKAKTRFVVRCHIDADDAKGLVRQLGDIYAQRRATYLARGR